VTCETGEWPRDFIEVTVIALKKKPKATSCNDHCPVILIAVQQSSESRKRIERKFRMFVEKISMDIEEEKELGMQLVC
jgi:hypothetical protein